ATSENLLNSFVNLNQHLDQKIVFHASEAGLCNRLRALCSCFCMSKILEIPLEICWEPQAACDCNFDDLYERVTENNVKFISVAELNSIDNPSQVIYINKMKHKNYFYETYLKDKVEQKDFDQEYVRFMRQLKVKPHLLLKINEFTQNFMPHDDILGVHIRRTDHVNYIRSNYPESVFSSDAKFISAIGKEIFKGYSKIFLATDNQLTKDMIFQNFPDLVISYCQDFNDNYQQKIDKNNQRHTTVEDALIDLYLLSKCKKIIGSYGSSFSEYAALLGKIPLIYP
ncbi:nodulation protein NodZ, partial [Planktothrix tepida]